MVPYGVCGLSGPCLERCAAVRNKAVNALETRDVGMVGYRYLQARQSQWNCTETAIANAILWLGTCGLHLLALGDEVAQVKNVHGYVQTIRACEDFLRRTRPALLADVRALYARGFYSWDLAPLIGVVAGYGFDVTSLQQKMAELHSARRARVQSQPPRATSVVTLVTPPSVDPSCKYLLVAKALEQPTTTLGKIAKGAEQACKSIASLSVDVGFFVGAPGSLAALLCAPGQPVGKS